MGLTLRPAIQRWAIACLGLSFGLAAAAQAASPLAARRLQGLDRIVIDGKPFEDTWLKSAPLTRFVPLDPVADASAPLRTEVRLARDAEHLYVALWAYEPDGIDMQRDRLTVYIDTAGDRRQAVFFGMTPGGERTEGVFDERSGTAQARATPGFTGRSGRFGGGWTVELAIALSSLPAPVHGDGPWSLLVTRERAREQPAMWALAAADPPQDCLLCMASNLQSPGTLETRWASAPPSLPGAAPAGGVHVRLRAAPTDWMPARKPGDKPADKPADQPVPAPPAEPALPAIESAAQRSASPTVASRLAAGQAVVLDGRLDDDAWRLAQPLARFFQIDPVPGPSAPVRTEVRFVYDDKNLYVAVWAHDPDLAALHAPLSRRDGIEADHDHVTVYLDTTGERRFAQFFDVNPAGVVADGMFNEQTGLDDPSPNYRFQSRTGRFSGGWTIELAIPFSSLMYRRDAAKPWSVLVTRNYPREQAYYMASAALPQNANCLLCFGAELTGLVDLPADAALQGSVTLSTQHGSERAGAAPRQSSHGTSAGAELKLRPRSDTVVNMTLRPDFSQVEIDAPQLASNTRYALYFPEKRQFFLETADVIESPLPVLRTRAIAAPTWGLRASQRNDRMDATVIMARDRGAGSLLLPGPESTESVERREASKVLMARARMHLDGVTVGALYSHRDNGPALGNNRVAGVDLSWSPSVSDRIDVQWLHSASSALQRERGLPETGNAALLHWSRKSDATEFETALHHYGRGFRADNGFIEMAGARHLLSKLTLKRRKVGPFLEAGPFIGYEARQSLDGPVLDARRLLGAYANLPLFTTLWAAPWAPVNRRATAMSASHALSQHQFGLKTVPAWYWLSEVTFDATFGDSLDVLRDRVGRGREAHLMVRLQPFDRLHLQWLADELLIKGDARWLSERTSQWLAVLFLAPDQYLRLIKQSRRVQRDAAVGTEPAAQFDSAYTLSYQARLGSELLLDAGLTSGRLRAFDGDWTSDQRELFAKLTWDFR